MSEPEWVEQMAWQEFEQWLHEEAKDDSGDDD